MTRSISILTRPARHCEWTRNSPRRSCARKNLSGFLHQGLASGYVAREVARRLHAALPDARIVIFVRAQPSAAVSWYLQYLREGGTASVRRYLFADAYAHAGHDRPFKLPRFDFSQIDYAGLIRRYDALFGAENVLVIPYEQLARDREATLSTMGERLGVTLTARSTRRVNSGYRRALMPLARAANLFTERAVPGKTTLVHLPYWYVVRKALFAQLNRSPVFGRSPKADTLLDHQTQDWIAQRFWVVEPLARGTDRRTAPPARLSARPARTRSRAAGTTPAARLDPLLIQTEGGFHSSHVERQTNPAFALSLSKGRSS